MRFLLIAFGMFVVSPLQAQRETAPAPRPVPTRGQAMIERYFQLQAQQIADQCLTNLTTRENWEKQRPELHRQFMDMMGLWPLPPRTDLKPVITGTVQKEDFTVEKVVFQSRPGLYVTGNLYLPKPDPAKPNAKFPTVLYVCGHANIVENNISFGSKAHYQYHPAWFAAHGYVCLILDTLQLSEIPGIHHGTYRYGMWWWQSRGYTPAGVELWNAMRAIDYLVSRPEVDAKKIGVTGRSGGGATSWWIAAADERVQAAVPVAGITDLYSHVCEGFSDRLRKGVITGHCDCMYMVNTHRWDFALVAALIAPRPLLLGNSDADDIFPVKGYRNVAQKVLKVYSLYGADEKFQLLETQGPHKDTPELLLGINGWMNRWLKNEPQAERAGTLTKQLTPQQLKVLERTPEGALNDSIHETFVKAASAEMPRGESVIKAWWPGQRAQLMTQLNEQVFAGWSKNPPALAPKSAGDLSQDGVRLRAIDFTSEQGIDLRLFLMTAAQGPKPETVVLSVLDDRGWETWCHDLGPQFAAALQIKPTFKRNDAKFEQNRTVMEAGKIAFAAIAPRGIGPTRWAEPGSMEDIQYRRRFALIGQTLEGQRVWDVRRAITALGSATDLKGAKLRLHGDRESAGIALYAGLYEPTVAAFDLWRLPVSHRNGPTLLNVLKVLDLPQAVALAGPREVNLFAVGESEKTAWDWPQQIQKATAGQWLKVQVVGE